MSVEEISQCLLNGGVALLPTDTVYGLAASPLHPKAVARIFSLKARPQTHNLPIMVASAADIAALGVDINAHVQKLLASAYVPGDITMVMGFKTTPSVSWLEGRDEVAIRIPNHPLMLAVLEKTGPLLVTSANRHGNPTTPLTVEEVLADLTDAPDIAIDGGIVENVPSTIVNCHATPPMIERSGRIVFKEIFNILNND
jgi:L-threonylcarbamoyladenylate synthase